MNAAVSYERPDSINQLLKDYILESNFYFIEAMFQNKTHHIRHEIIAKSNSTLDFKKCALDKFFFYVCAVKK